MELTDLGVVPDPRGYGVRVAGNYGKQRIIADIDRVDLDDYFEKAWPHLDDAQRRILVEGNKEIIGAIVKNKCDAGEWQDEALPGGTVKRVMISRSDLFGAVPRLDDARLRVYGGAGFQKV